MIFVTGTDNKTRSTMMMMEKTADRPPDLLSEMNGGKSCDVLSIYTG